MCVSSREPHPRSGRSITFGIYARVFRSKITQPASSFFSEGFCIVKVSESAEVVAVNTVIDHHDEQSAKRGGFDMSRIEALRQYLRNSPCQPIRIGMMHHHPILHTAPFLTDADVIPTGDELVKALRESGCQFIVHGHRHVPRLTMHNDVAIFASGSFSANLGVYATAVSNMFHIVELEEDNSQVTGRIKSWVYRHGEGWALAHPNHSGFPPMTGFDARLSVASVYSGLLQAVQNDPAVTTFDCAFLRSTVPGLEFLPPDGFLELQQKLVAAGLKLVDPFENGEFELRRLVGR